MRKIPVIEMLNGSEVHECPPDGNYAVITHAQHLTRKIGATVPTAFPWMARIYQFKDGVGDDIACGSDLAAMITDYNVAKVYLVGINAVDRRELDQKLSEKQIELVV